MQVNPLETVFEEDESAAVAAADPQLVEIDVDSQQTAEAAAPVVTMSDLEGTPSDTMATPQAPVSTHQSAPTPSPTPQRLLQQQGANVNAQPFVSSLSSLGPMPGSEVQFNGNPFENVSGHPYLDSITTASYCADGTDCRGIKSRRSADTKSVWASR